MKTLFTYAFILSVLVVVTIDATAQDIEVTHEHKHHHDFHDSAYWYDWAETMSEFNFDYIPYFKKKHKSKYNGHWAGVDLGISGYVNSDFSMNFEPADYLNMNTARSLMVNLNPFELNVNLYKKHIGFTSGIGFQFNNYFFTDNYILIEDSTSVAGFRVKDSDGNPVNLEKNKLTVSWLNLPLLFEYQTNPYRRINSFHVTFGVIAGVRIGTYTKQKYYDEEETYYLVDDKGNEISSYYIEHHKVHDHGAFHLAPFKVDAALRFGWSHLNFFTTYSLTKMFLDNQGPVVYPYTVGITLLGW